MSADPTPFAIYRQIGRTYIRWAPFLLLLAAIVFVPVGLIHALTVSAEIGSFDVDELVEVFAAGAAVLALVVTGLLGEVFYTGAVAVSLTHAHDDKPPSLREIAKTVDYGRLIAIDLIYGALVAVGLLLFVVPGVLAFVWLALADVLANLAFTPFYAVAAVLFTVELIWRRDGGGPRLHSEPIR